MSAHAMTALKHSISAHYRRRQIEKHGQTREMVGSKDILGSKNQFLLRFSLFLISLLFLVGSSGPDLANGKNPLFIDFVQYWSAARLLIDGKNPYDPILLEEVERAALPALPETIIQWNPPTAFLLTVPFGLLPYQFAQGLWVCVLVILLACSIQLTLHFTPRLPSTMPHRLLQLASLLTFFPLWECLRFAQISPFLLIGFVGFLLLRSQSHRSSSMDFWAGVLLSLTLLKPHLLFLVYALLIIESARTARVRTLAGLAAGGLALGIFPLLFSRSIWIEYLIALKAWPSYFQTPTLGSWLQAFYPGDPLARFIPSAVALVATAYVFVFHWAAERYSALLFAALCGFSMVCAPYGWVFDHVLLVPSIALLLCSTQWGPWGGSLAALILNVLGFPWSGSHPMQYKVWYPFAVGAATVVFSRNRKQGSLNGESE